MYRAWLPALLSDPTLFHAGFAHYNTHVNALVREHNVPVSLKHKGLALHQMSKKIELSGKAPTDEMIAAVLCLVSSEVCDRVHFAVMCSFYHSY